MRSELQNLKDFKVKRLHNVKGQQGGLSERLESFELDKPDNQTDNPTDDQIENQPDKLINRRFLLKFERTAQKVQALLND